MTDHRAPPSDDLDPATPAGSMFHHSADALLVVDPISERVLEANAAAATMTEFSRDELSRFSLRALVRHEQEWQDWCVGPTTTTPPPGNDRFLVRTRRPERWVPVSVAITRLTCGGDLLALCRLRDRREQIESQRRALRAEAELRRVLGSVSDAIYSGRIADGRWLLRYVSPPLLALAGSAEPASREARVAAEDLPRWREMIARAAAGQAGELEYRLRRPDGARAWVREAVVVTPDEGGLLVHGVLTDISDQKRAARDAPDATAARLDGLARLAGTVAAGFNDLLSGILGQVSLAALGEDAAMCLAGVEAVALRATEQCRRLATFAGHAVAGGVTDVVALARRLVAEATAQPGQRVRVEAPAGLPPVAGGEGPLALLMGALLANALDALEGLPGEVRVEVSLRGRGPAPEAACYPAERPATPCVCVEFSDSGPGLPDETRARLFEPYFSTRPGRRGEGLATALGVARGLGGALEVVSAPGGATFRALLPVAEVPRPGPARGGTVLLIDDEAGVRDVAIRLFATLGVALLTAPDGEEGLALLRRHTDVRTVLVDWNLPRLSGAALVAQVRQVSPPARIYIMSGYAEQDLAPRVCGLGIAGFLQKPFRLQALIDLLGTDAAAKRP